MFIDVAIPDGNEEEFIAQAKKLGTNGLIFLYEKEPKKIEAKDFRILVGLVAKGNTHKKKGALLFSRGERAHFENPKTDVVFEIEKDTKKDKTHYRSAGLNQVLCQLAKEKNISIAFSFNQVLLAKDKGTLLGKMMQNAKLCRKYKNNLLTASFARNPCELRYYKDLISFGIVLGLHPSEAKDAVLNRKI